MERLTKRVGDRVFISDEKHPDIVNMAYKKLATYEDAEEQGLLVRLPCKLGDKVYEASKQWNMVITRTVAAIVIYNDSIWIRNGCGDSFEYNVEVFLAREEAEKALAGMKGE